MKEQCTIIIDTREQDMLIYLANVLTHKYGRSPDKIKVNELPVGDIKLIAPDGEQSITIERKSHKDFRASFTDGRLARQPFELGNEENGILLIHGNIHNKELWKNMKWKDPEEVVSKILATLTIEESAEGGSIKVVQVPYESHVPAVIDHWAKKLESGDMIRGAPEGLKRIKKHKKSLSDPLVHRYVLIDIMSSIPNLGKKNAKLILDHFEWEFDRIYNAYYDDFMAIKGIGQVMARRVYETFHNMTYSKS